MPNDTAKTPYKHFRWGAPINGEEAIYFNRSGFGDSYLAFTVSAQGIVILADNDFASSFLPETLKRETVDVMRELVARFDALAQKKNTPPTEEAIWREIDSHIHPMTPGNTGGSENLLRENIRFFAYQVIQQQIEIVALTERIARLEAGMEPGK